MQELYQAVHEHPDFKSLQMARSRLSWILTFAVLAGYLSFVLIIAFAPELFAAPISTNSTTSWGIPVGLFVIVYSFLLTGIYVHQSNAHFDPELKRIIDEVRTGSETLRVPPQ
ncbi:MAG: DUF485 domain-containing protein [Gammaproteobacteria bacterium]